MIDIKAIVKDNTAVFDRFRNGVLFYKIYKFENDNASVRQVCYEFPVPSEDLGGATLNQKEKGLTMMRYIRKAIEEKTLVEKVLAEAPKCLI